MSLEIKEVKNSSDFKEFVKLQFDLYKNQENWAPPLFNQEIKSIQKDHNPAYELCDATFWTVHKERKTVGRIGAIVNEKYNEKIGKKFGRFTRFECFDDQEVANLLFSTAIDWLKSKGMKAIHGPLGFTNLDTQGMLIEGFDHLQSIASVYHLPYYQKLVENFGFEKEIDWVEFRLTLGENAVNKASRGAQLIQKRYGIEVVHFSKISEMMPYADHIFKILNEAFDILPYVVPFTDALKEFYKEKYLKMLNPEFVKIVKMKDEIIGFLIGMPSMSEAMKKANGKLFPFGFYHLLQGKKGKGETMDQLLTGVKPEHQATGAAVVLMAELQNAMVAKGMKYIETTGIFETNLNAISNWKNYEHIQHKRRRCFVKEI